MIPPVAPPGFLARLEAQWEATRPILTGLVIGLIAGPLISGFAGWQVRTSTAEAATHAGVVEQQAMFCVERARAAGPIASPLDWQARTDLARRFASAPGAAAADPEVVYACSGKLSG
jgi:hypothetical protein